MEQEEIQLLLRFALLDQDKAKQASDKLAEIEEHMQLLQKVSDGLKTSMGNALSGSEYSDGLKTKLGLVEDEMVSLEGEAGKLKQQINDALSGNDTGTGTGSSAQVLGGFQTRFALSEISRVGMAVANAGTAINNVITGSITAYLATANAFDSSANRWKAAQAEMQASFARIGGIAIQQLLPTVELVARVTDDIAKLVEKNPWMVNAAVGMGSVMLLIGKTTELITQTALLIMAVQMLQKTSMFSSLTGMLGGDSSAGALGAVALPVAGIVTAITGGVLAGLAGNELLNKGGAPNAPTNQVLTVGALGLGTMFGNLMNLDDKEIQRKALVFAAVIAKMTGAIDENSPMWLKAWQSIPQNAPSTTNDQTFAQQNVDLYIQYEQAKADAAAKYGEQIKQVEADTAAKRVQIIQQFATQAAAAESNYARQRSSAVSSYQNAEAKAEEAYQQQRLKAQETFNVDMQRMAQDHQIALQKLEEGHTSRVRDLVAARDALGLMKENESYQQQKNDENSKYNLEAQRKKEDYQRQMADLLTNFITQRNQRAKDFAIQMADMAKAHAAEMATLQQNEQDQLDLLAKSKQDQLSKLRDAYAQQVDLLDKGFIQQINKMLGIAIPEVAKYISQFAQYVADLRAKANATSGQKAAGGPVMGGLTYLVGENGPELFTAPSNGSIVPNGLTSKMLSQAGSGGRSMTLKIESQALTMTEIVSELDRRFARYDQVLTSAFA